MRFRETDRNPGDDRYPGEARYPCTRVYEREPGCESAAPVSWHETIYFQTGTLLPSTHRSSHLLSPSPLHRPSHFFAAYIGSRGLILVLRRIVHLLSVNLTGE